MNARVIITRALWRTAAVAAIITASITGSILIEQNIAASNRTHQNFQQQINSLNHSVSALQNPKQSAAQQKLTLQFVNEINYICLIEADTARAEGFPPPQAGLCDLVLPPKTAPTTAAHTPAAQPARSSGASTPASATQPTPAPTPAPSAQPTAPAKPKATPKNCVLFVCV